MKSIPYGTGPLEKKDAGEHQNADTREIKTILDEHSRTVKTFMDKVDDEMGDMKKSMDKKSADPIITEQLKKMNEALDEQKTQVEGLRLANQRPMMTAPDGTKQVMTDEQLEHKEAYGKFFRKGEEGNLRELELKTLSVGSDPDGGYMVPTQVEQALDRVITETSDIRAISRVVQVSSASYKKRVGMGGATSGWVGEQAGRSGTETPTIEELEFPVMELYAMPGATQSLLDDAAFDVDGWLAEEVGIEFAIQEGAAFVNGNGSKKPKGFLSHTNVENDSWEWGKIGYVATGKSGGFLDTAAGDESDNLVDLVYSLKSAFRRNARFVMNDKSISVVRKFKDGNGLPLWHSGLRDGEPDRILGYGLSTVPDMPDIAADSYSLAFGDFNRGYTIVDRMGTRVLRDPFTSKPYVLFYTTKRTGGGVSHYDAIKLLKFAA